MANHYWCTTEACRKRQAEHSIGVRRGDEHHYLYVPLPAQVDFDGCSARYLLGGGAAGSTKSHQARWGMYRRCLAVKDYEALLLRRTWDELNKHHFRLMDREAKIFQNYGLNVTFSITNREMKFHDTGAVIEGGHMESAEDVDKYLSRERDEIVLDEGVTFEPRPLLELSTRARSTKPQVLATGSRGLFRVYTNPGGASSSVLRDFFIDHEPNWEDFPPELKEDYHPAEWVYIPGNLEDNPYLPESYERDLAILTPWRYQQLRHNDWDIVAGQFFTEFTAAVHVAEQLYADRIMSLVPSLDVFRSLDWGYINPGCVLWWVCLTDSTYMVIHEYKFSHADIPHVCDMIKEQDQDLGIARVRYTAADPALWQPHGQTGEAMSETFAKNGVPLLKSNNERFNGWQRVRELFRVRDDGRPTLLIHPFCRYLIRTISSAVSARNNPEDVDTTIDDHAIDTLRYGAMSRPAPTRRTTKTSNKTFKAAQERIKQHRRAMTVR